MSEQTKSRSASQGTLLWRISKKFNFAAEKIIPDSFVFCVILMLAVFVLSLLLCGKSPLDLLIAWWNGLSSQFTLAFQMGLMVIVTSTCARSPQAAKLLNKIASLVNTRTAALIVLMIFGYVTSMLNWAFCTIVTPILAMHLAKRIKGLGNVNPVAVEEYRKLKERRDFIAIQVEDLEGAAKALDRIVAAIDRKMRNRFMETFNQVNANFQDIFQALFPGGQGHLELTDPESPETTGVEVHAQPRGKAVRKQSLLSGGEQSLVSLALLFAVYRVNNTPFYILDEVEAALDDTNLRRLLSYLDTIRGGTQIIMISHQRRTMEMADLLYGVSMRSDGVSKLVSQKLDQAIRSVGGSGGARDVESFTGAQ